jgi:meiotically up-regulated gene 157 (Mug157) protein
MYSATQLPVSIELLIEQVAARYPDHPRRAVMFRACLTNTLITTMQPQPDGSVFVITGDIPAMWLRDSSAQVRPYLIPAAGDAALADLLVGVSRRQMQYISIDPYANAFNAEPSGRSWDAADETEMNDWLWERKYEVDSLCYPLQLAYLIWKATGRTDHFDDQFRGAARAVIATWRTEQDHRAHSRYRFVRRNCPPTDTLSHDGLGAPVEPCGMTWSGFRPSDDACTYGYLVPANMFAAVALGYLAEIASAALRDDQLAGAARALEGDIRAGLAAHAIVAHPEYGQIYAYEADGRGNHLLMDDANIPSLLALPYLGWCAPDDPLYLATRRFVLSEGNPFFFRGRAAAGVGSPHTPPRYIWHLALAMQGLTATDPRERTALIELLEATDAGTGLMHEGFDVDDPARFTRPWFAWANSMYSELVLLDCGISVPGSPLASL